jgi:hypothetical protein
MITKLNRITRLKVDTTYCTSYYAVKVNKSLLYIFISNQTVFPKTDVNKKKLNMLINMNLYHVLFNI